MESQTVVVTGASAGIGRATARLFGERHRLHGRGRGRRKRAAAEVITTASLGGRVPSHCPPG
jgi:NAD(P)-dependent dehydrogenase (short-subunit alcohol dehydrogenase family)